MKNFKLYRNNQITQDSKIDADRADYNFLCAREDSDSCRVGKDSYFILTYNVPTGSGGTSIKIMNIGKVGTSVFLGCEIDGGGLITVTKNSGNYFAQELSDGEHTIKVYCKHTLSNLDRLFWHGGYSGIVNPFLVKFDGSNLNTTNLTNMEYTFYGCGNMKECIVDNWNVEKLSNLQSTFYLCKKLKKLDISRWNAKSILTLSHCFYGCGSLTKLDVKGFNTTKCTNFNNTFNACSSVKTLDVSNWNTSNVTSMSGTFKDCKSLVSLDVSNFNTSAVTDMAYMFGYASNLKTIDVSKFVTSAVTTMEGMFIKCKINEINVSNFDTKKVTLMNGMFSDASNLKTIDVSKFVTSAVTNMAGMFQNCTSLQSINVTNFDTSKVKSMANMFVCCKSLKELDLTSFDTQKLVSSGCSKMFQTADNNSDDMQMTKLKLGDNFFNIIPTTTSTIIYFFFPYNWSHDSLVESLYTNQMTRDKTKLITIKLNALTEMMGRLSDTEKAQIAENGITITF